MSLNEDAVTAVSIIGPSAAVLNGLREVRNVLAPDLTDGELQLFAMVASRSGLDPFAKQIYAIKRKGRVTFQTGIDGLRSIAARTGEYDGQDAVEYGADCPCPQNPKPHPLYATVRVYRKGISRPIPATAFWHEYLPDQTFQWIKMPHLMLGKVAEALALRKAFPWDPNAQSGIGGDLYTDEEMVQAQRQEQAPEVADRLANRRLNAEILAFDTNLIREVAAGMFPEMESVNSLSLDEKRELLSTLQSLPVTVIDGETGEIIRSEPQAGTQPVCGAVSEDGSTCSLPVEHPGPHRSDDEGEIWPVAVPVA